MKSVNVSSRRISASASVMKLLLSLLVAVISCHANITIRPIQSLSSIRNQQGLLSLKNNQSNNNNNNINSIQLLNNVRGGATTVPKKKSSQKKSRTTTASSKIGNKTATGKKKVGGTKDEENKSAISDAKEQYKKILPLTRIYLTLVVIISIGGLIIGEELAQEILALDPIRTIYGLQVWRPILAACFLGPPSLSWIFNGYYLYEYGTQLERAYGTAQHIIFIMTQLILLTLLSTLVKQPFITTSMITAMLHVLSRAMPLQKVNWLLFKVPYYLLPYAYIAADVLQAQSLMAAIPHILGILSGHFYQFHKFIWPKVNNSAEDWLIAPKFLSKRFDANYKNDDDKDSINKALKSRKRKGGRKLGSSSTK